MSQLSMLVSFSFYFFLVYFSFEEGRGRGKGAAVFLRVFACAVLSCMHVFVCFRCGATKGMYARVYTAPLDYTICTKALAILLILT